MEIITVIITSITAICVVFLNYYIYKTKKELVEKSAKDVTNLITSLDKKVSGYWKFFSRWRIYRKARSSFKEKASDNEDNGLYLTLFDYRKDHYKEEKDLLCENILHHLLVNNKGIQEFDKVYLMIDSGSTVFPIFKKLCEHYRSEKYSNLLKKIEIITNNIPGQNELMKHGRKGDDYKADMCFQCHTIPGIVEGKYNATLGLNSVAYIGNFVTTVRNKKKNSLFISVITGNYISTVEGILTRGTWHGMVKNALIHNADIVFIISPLGKIFDEYSQKINEMIENSPMFFPPEKTYRPLSILSKEEQFFINDINNLCGLSKQDVEYICLLIEFMEKSKPNHLIPNSLLDKNQTVYLVTTERDLQHNYPNDFYKYFSKITNKLHNTFDKERILSTLFLPQLHSDEFIIKMEAIREIDLYYEYEFPHKEIREYMRKSGMSNSIGQQSL